jgi:hypothetical protein
MWLLPSKKKSKNERFEKFTLTSVPRCGRSKTINVENCVETYHAEAQFLVEKAETLFCTTRVSWQVTGSQTPEGYKITSHEKLLTT